MSNPSDSKVYISYAWKGDSERVADELDAEFQKRGIPLARDKRALGYRGEISGFMQQIGRGDAVVVVICDKYLKSDNCMYELIELGKNADIRERIFPIVLHDAAAIYDPVKRIDYMTYWADQLKALDEKMGLLSHANQQGLREEIDMRAAINTNIARLTYLLKDMNALTPEEHENTGFQALVDSVQARLRQVGQAAPPAAAAAAPAASKPAPEAALLPVPGLDDALAELTDPGSSADIVRVNATDNAGQTLALMLLVVEEGQAALVVPPKAGLAELQLAPEAWGRLNRAGVAGAARPLGLLHKLSPTALAAEVGRMLALFGLPDDRYAVDAEALDSHAEEDADGGEGEEADAAAEPADIDGFDDALAALLDPRRRGDWQVTVYADDGQGDDPVEIAYLERYADDPALYCDIASNGDLPEPLRQAKDVRQALRQQHGFEPEAAGGLTAVVGEWRGADPGEVRALLDAVLAIAYGLPNDGYSLSAALEAG